MQSNAICWHILCLILVPWVTQSLNSHGLRGVLACFMAVAPSDLEMYLSLHLQFWRLQNVKVIYGWEYKLGLNISPYSVNIDFFRFFDSYNMLMMLWYCNLMWYVNTWDFRANALLLPPGNPPRICQELTGAVGNQLRCWYGHTGVICLSYTLTESSSGSNNQHKALSASHFHSDPDNQDDLIQIQWDCRSNNIKVYAVNADSIHHSRGIFHGENSWKSPLTKHSLVSWRQSISCWEVLSVLIASGLSVSDSLPRISEIGPPSEYLRVAWYQINLTDKTIFKVYLSGFLGVYLTPAILLHYYHSDGNVGKENSSDYTVYTSKWCLLHSKLLVS